MLAQCELERQVILEAGFVDTAVVMRRLFRQAKREVLIAGFRVTDRALLENLRRPEARKLDVGETWSS